MFKKLINKLQSKGEMKRLTRTWKEIATYNGVHNKLWQTFPLINLKNTDDGYTAHTVMPYGLNEKDLYHLAKEYGVYDSKYKLSVEKAHELAKIYSVSFVRTQ